MKLTATMFVTLDGVYQAPGGRQEDPSGGFVHGGWSVPYGDEDFGRSMTGVFERVDAFLLGKTNEIFASYWPHQTDHNDPIVSKLNRLQRYAASRTLASAQPRTRCPNPRPQAPALRSVPTSASVPRPTATTPTSAATDRAALKRGQSRTRPECQTSRPAANSRSAAMARSTSSIGTSRWSWW